MESATPTKGVSLIRFLPGLSHQYHHFKVCIWWGIPQKSGASRAGMLWSGHNPRNRQRQAVRSVRCQCFTASRLFFLVGLFGSAGPRLLLGNRQLDITGVLQGCLRRQRLRSFLEETHLQNYFETGQWHPRDIQIFQLSPGAVSELRSHKVRSDWPGFPGFILHGSQYSCSHIKRA